MRRNYMMCTYSTINRHENKIEIKILILDFEFNSI